MSAYVGKQYTELPSPPKASVMLSIGWTVIRHGGNGNHCWRRVFGASQRSIAEARFKTEDAKLRQGGLALVDPDGVVQRYSSAPRLRRFW